MNGAFRWRVRAIAFVVTLFAPSFAASAQIEMTISRFQAARLNDTRADQILLSAKAVLSKVGGPGDVSCDVNFQRAGAVTVFSNVGGAIDSNDDFQRVCEENGNVHVVNEINWCGDFKTGRIGCSSTPGDCMVVVRYYPDLEGILWAHEFGHSKGLYDRDERHAVMRGKVTSDSRRVNAFECDTYTSPPPSNSISGWGKTAASPQPSPTSKMSTEGEGRPEADVQEFVRQTFIHGVPYELARQYPGSATPTLLKMLSDPQDSAYRANIVATLGMIGTGFDLVDRITAFLKAGKGRISAEDYRAKETVLMALGYLANRGESEKAFVYLRDSLDPGISKKRGLKWESPFQSSNAERSAVIHFGYLGPGSQRHTSGGRFHKIDSRTEKSSVPGGEEKAARRSAEGARESYARRTSRILQGRRSVRLAQSRQARGCASL